MSIVRSRVPADEVTPSKHDIVPCYGLSGDEREANITINYQSEMMVIYAEIKTIVRSLIEHSEFDPEWYHFNEDGICAVKGEMPHGALKISKSSRSQNLLSKIVSDQKDVDQSRFEGDDDE